MLSLYYIFINFLKKIIFKFFIFAVLFINSLQLVVKSNQNINSTNLSIEDNLNNSEDNLDEDEYLLGPGDVLKIDILDASEFSGNYAVLNDGTIRLPLINKVKINNLTLDQATNKLRTLLSKELIRPELYLNLKVQRPIKVSVIGEVERPGLYSLTEDEVFTTVGGQSVTNKGLPTIIDSIQKAGGVTQNANLSSVQLKRRLAGDKNIYKSTNLNLIELLINGNQANNPYLFDGDIVFIGKAENLEPRLLNIAASNLSPKIININIIGEVKKPGRIQVPANTTMMQSILLAGGFKEIKASKHKVQLLRMNRNGSATLKRISVNINSGISLKNNPPLKNGDIVKVGSSSFGKAANTLRTISEPIRDIITAATFYKLFND